MKRLPFTRHWLVLTIIFLLALSACERPVPRENTPESPDVAPTTDVIIIPTAVATADAAATAVVTDAGETGATTTDTPAEATAASTDATDTAAATPPEQATVAAGGEVTHVVKTGETLGEIAQFYNVSIADIAAANDITDIDSLEVGQTLVIKTDTANGGGETPGTGEQVYIVKAGDNLFRIGLRFGFTAEQLAAYNNIPNVTRIDAGQVIKIPPK